MWCYTGLHAGDCREGLWRLLEEAGVLAADVPLGAAVPLCCWGRSWCPAVPLPMQGLEGLTVGDAERALAVLWVASCLQVAWVRCRLLSVLSRLTGRGGLLAIRGCLQGCCLLMAGLLSLGPKIADGCCAMPSYCCF